MERNRFHVPGQCNSILLICSPWWNLQLGLRALIQMKKGSFISYWANHFTAFNMPVFRTNSSSTQRSGLQQVGGRDCELNHSHPSFRGPCWPPKGLWSAGSLQLPTPSKSVKNSLTLFIRFHMSGIIWYLSFSDWLISFSIMSRSIHTVAKSKTFFFTAE